VISSRKRVPPFARATSPGCRRRYSYLDFTNTEASEAGSRADLLTSDQDFVAWLVLAKLFERNELKAALEQWRQQKKACAFGRMRLRCVR
jgi:hypothetical protein